MFTHEYETPFVRRIAELNRQAHPDLCEMEDLCEFFPSFLATFVYTESDPPDLFETVRSELMDLLTSNPNDTKLQFVERLLLLIASYVEGHISNFERTVESGDYLEPHPFPEFLKISTKDFSEESMRVLEESYGRIALPSATSILARIRLLKTLMFDAYRIFTKVMVVHQDARALSLSAGLMEHYLKPLEVLSERYRTVLSNIGDREVEDDFDLVMQESRNHLISAVIRSLFAALSKSKSSVLRLDGPSVGPDRLRLGNVFANHLKREADFVEGEREFFKLGSTMTRYVVVASKADDANRLRHTLANATVLSHDTDPLLVSAMTNMEYAIRTARATHFVYYGEPASPELFERGILRQMMDGRPTETVRLQVREYFGYLDADYVYVNGKPRTQGDASEEREGEFVRVWTDSWELTGAARELLRGRRYRGVGSLRRSSTVYALEVRGTEGQTAKVHFHLPAIPTSAPPTKAGELMEKLRSGDAVRDTRGVLVRTVSGMKGSAIRAVMGHPTPSEVLRDIWGERVGDLTVSAEECVCSFRVSPYTLRFEVRGEADTRVRVFQGEEELPALQREGGESSALNPLFLVAGPHALRAYHELRPTGSSNSEPPPSELTLPASESEDGEVHAIALHQYARWTVNRVDSKWTEIAALFDLERIPLRHVTEDAQAIYERELLRVLCTREHHPNSKGLYRDMAIWSSYTAYVPTMIVSDDVNKKEGALEYLMGVYESNMV